MLFVLILILLFVGYGVVEFQLHCRRLHRIPIRVQVNGTRGKSSVTRLIAAGLRAGGLKVIAKTTGTTPRFIISDQEEAPVKRTGKANIIENVRLLIQASRYEPQAIVFECMALVPQYQWTDAHQVIQPTHGVITNARADHLDVMGPTVRDVALALSNTIPGNRRPSFTGSSFIGERRTKNDERRTKTPEFFTAEKEYYPIFARQAERNGARMHQARAETVSDDDMKGFTYIEHKENVALALLVCENILASREPRAAGRPEAGADSGARIAASGKPPAASGWRSAVLAGMHRTLPDPGVLRVYTIRDGNRSIEIVNTLAANDPDSILMLWQMMQERIKEKGERRKEGIKEKGEVRNLDLSFILHPSSFSVIVLVNCRADRTERSRQLAEMCAHSFQADYYVATGGLTGIFMRAAASLGLPKEKVISMGDDWPPEKVYAGIRNLVRNDVMVFATGNIVGYGDLLIQYFATRGGEIAY